MNKKRKINKFIKIVIALCFIIGGFVGYKVYSDAVFDESKAVHIKANDIENSTLIIGTHLIHLSALTDEIYDIAIDSQTQAKQFKIYYKSELAGGAWYEITEASALTDIDGSSAPVDNSVIENLFLTHHTKSDKITYDLRTNGKVNIFNITDPYDGDTLEELEPIREYYNMVVKKQTEQDKDGKNISWTYQRYVAWYFLYATNYKDAVTQECDYQINKLQNYYEYLAGLGDQEAEIDIVSALMKAVDAKRRWEYFGNILNHGANIDAFQNCIKGNAVCIGVDNPDWWYTKLLDPEEKEYVEDTAFTDTFTDAKSNVQESYIKYEQLMLQEGTTVLTKEEYNLDQNLITQARNGNYDDADDTVDKLIYLSRVNDGIINERDKEKNYISSSILPAAINEYLAGLKAGVSEKYTAQSQNKQITRKALNAILKEDKTGLNSKRMELQFIVQAYVDRMDEDAAGAYLDSQITECKNWKTQIKADAFNAYAEETRNDYEEWLTKLKNSLIVSEEDAQKALLEEQKEDYQNKYLACLDKSNPDLAGAARYEALIKAVDEKLADLDNNSSLINELADQVYEDARNEDYDGAQDGLAALASLISQSPGTVGNALDNLASKLENLAEQEGSGSGNTGNNNGNNTGDNNGNNNGNNTGDNNGNNNGNNTGDNNGNNNGNNTGNNTGNNNGNNNGNNTGNNNGNNNGNNTGNNNGNNNGNNTGDNNGNNNGNNAGNNNGNNNANQNGNQDNANTSVDKIANQDGNKNANSDLDKLLDKTAELQNDAAQAKKSASIASMSTNQLMDLLLELLGISDFNELSNDQQAGIVLALEWFGENNNIPIANKLAAKLAEKFNNSENPYFELKYTRSSEEYVSTEKLAKAFKYRYVFDKKEIKVDLAKDGHYYSFKQYSKDVTTGKDVVTQMSTEAVYQSTVYIPEEYSNITFGIQVEYLNECSIGVLYDKAVETNAKNILATLENVG